MCLAIPVAFGICVNYKWPKQSKIILKVSWSLGQRARFRPRHLADAGCCPEHAGRSDTALPAVFLTCPACLDPPPCVLQY